MSKHRLFIFLLTFVAFISGLSLVSAQREIPALVKKVKPAVVVIYTYDSNGELLGQGSGFFVNAKGDVITNIHVLLGAYRGEVKTSQGESYFIKGVIGQDIEGDLVKIVLDISDKTFPYLRVCTSLPEDGERVVVIGHPLGLEQTVSDGIVSVVRYAPPLGQVIQITAPISPGSSGSPVVNMDGDVVGVVALMLGKGQSLNFAIPGEKIVNLKPRKIQALQEWTTVTGDEWLESAKGLFFSGLSILWEEDYEGALPYFEEAIKKNPDFAEAHYWLGWAYSMLGRHKEAIKVLKESIR
ncbi:MAG: trypsin-like peptidase domain-containing protein, partial [Candidatus Helarchaeota archaeon]|nr:trypsin-like peptidase domain-containing protein [Candidatus Helarchaeota archaeon]